MRIVRGNSTPVKSDGRVSKALMQKRLARQAAIEKNLARYPMLECGHYTTLETVQRYGAWRPNRKVTMCEHDQCQRWVKFATPQPPPIIPQEPLF